MNDRPVPLQPGQFPVEAVPRAFRWTFTGERAHPAAMYAFDPEDRCRMAHFDLCPARGQSDHPVIARLQARLAARYLRSGDAA